MFYFYFLCPVNNRHTLYGKSLLDAILVAFGCTNIFYFVGKNKKQKHNTMSDLTDILIFYILYVCIVVKTFP